MKQQHDLFTKYEIARILGARALQITMDAPFLVRISEEDLKVMRYDPLKIAEREFESGALPITISRPFPRRRKEKLTAVKEEAISDEEIAAKEQEVEKEIVEDASQMGLIEQEEEEETEITSPGEEQ